MSYKVPANTELTNTKPFLLEETHNVRASHIGYNNPADSGELRSVLEGGRLRKVLAMGEAHLSWEKVRAEL